MQLKFEKERRKTAQFLIVMNFSREGKKTKIPSVVWLAPRGTGTYEKFENDMTAKICNVKSQMRLLT